MSWYTEWIHYELLIVVIGNSIVVTHSMVVSLWDVTESLYIEISRSDGPQKGLAVVDLTHLKSYWVIHTISIGSLGHSKSLWVTLSHLILSQVILIPKSLRLLMLEVRQFKIRYTVTQWWLPPQCGTGRTVKHPFGRSLLRGNIAGTLLP